jgi:DNA-binding NarL/FixJ family response regulator
MRRGLLRFVLEGEGFDVVGEAGSASDLARLLAIHQPDVVVLDDGIGATAVGMAREVAPAAKVILVWPDAVVPIGGDARVDPAAVLKELGEATRQVLGISAPAFESFHRPDWIDRVKKDPAVLRDILARRGGVSNRRPSVTELQRRGQRLHPSSGMKKPAAFHQPPGEVTPEEKSPLEPLVILPADGTPEAGLEDTPENASSEPTIVLPDEGSPTRGRTPSEADLIVLADHRETLPGGGEGEPALVADDQLSAETDGREWNRRLGALALGGAAVAGVVVLALLLGGPRRSDLILADSPRDSDPFAGPAIIWHIPNQTDDDHSGGNGNGGDTGVGQNTGGGGTPSDHAPGTGGGGTGGGGTGGGGTGGGGTGGGGTGGGGTGGGGTGGGGTSSSSPGASATHNPNGGAPGQTGVHPQGGGASDQTPPGLSGTPGHAGEHGQGIDHGVGLQNLVHRHKR